MLFLYLPILLLYFFIILIFSIIKYYYWIEILEMICFLMGCFVKFILVVTKYFYFYKGYFKVKFYSYCYYFLVKILEFNSLLKIADFEKKYFTIKFLFNFCINLCFFIFLIIIICLYCLNVLIKDQESKNQIDKLNEFIVKKIIPRILIIIYIIITIKF